MLGRVFGAHGWANENCTRRSGDQMQIMVTPWAIYFSDVMTNAPWHVQLTGVIAGVVGVVVGLVVARLLGRGIYTTIVMGGLFFGLGWMMTCRYARKVTCTTASALKGAKSVPLARVETDLTVRHEKKEYHLSLPHAFGGEDAIGIKEKAFVELRDLVRKALNDSNFSFEIKQ